MRKPAYSIEVAKELLLDCAVDIKKSKSKAENQKISRRILSIVRELDRMDIQNETKGNAYEEKMDKP